MTAEPVVTARSGFGYGSTDPHGMRYSVRMLIDGRVWSFGCPHLHRSAQAARRCLGAVARDWTLWEDAERVVLDAKHDLVELRRPGIARRMHAVHADYWGDACRIVGFPAPIP